MLGNKLLNFAELLAVYVQSGGASPTLQSRTVTPSSSQQTIYPQSGYDALSSVIVNGDSNLVSGNIKSGVSIFGVTGTLVSKTVYQNLNQTLTITNSKQISIPWSQLFPYFAIAMNFPQYDANQNTVMGGFFFYDESTYTSFSAGAYWSNFQHWYYNNLFYIAQRNDSSVGIGVIDDANFFVGYSCEYSIVAWTD